MSRPRKLPVQDRSRETVAVILEAAAQVFQREGYAATTNRIAERAGVSVGSIYQYFPDKDALLVALADAHLAEAEADVVAAFDAVAAADLDLAEMFDLLVRGLVALHRDRPVLHQLLFSQAPHPPETVARFRALERVAADALAAQFARLDVGGPHPRFTAQLVVEGLGAQIHGAVLAGDDPPFDDRVDEVVALWTRTLAPRSRDTW